MLLETGLRVSTERDPEDPAESGPHESGRDREKTTLRDHKHLLECSRG